MTALKPLENRRVRGVQASRYPLNEKCAHPECREDTADAHHCFPRSEIGNSLWFVEIEDEIEDKRTDFARVIPHVIGLCRAHHDDVEEHRAWIKLEDEEFVWYDRHEPWSENEGPWDIIGPLNPQPGSREGKPKRKRFQGEAKRKRRTITIKVPNDAAEDGGALFDEMIENGREALADAGLISSEDAPAYPVYYTLMALGNSGLIYMGK